MATSTYISLATITPSGASSVTFSSIPATFRDLVLVIRNTSTVGVLKANFNNDTSTNYSRVQMNNAGSGGASSADTQPAIRTAVATNALQILQIMDYSATDKHKTVLVRTNRSGEVAAYAQRWADTSAINEIDVTLVSGTFTGTMSLYGIAS